MEWVAGENLRDVEDTIYGEADRRLYGQDELVVY